MPVSHYSTNRENKIGFCDRVDQCAFWTMLERSLSRCCLVGMRITYKGWESNCPKDSTVSIKDVLRVVHGYLEDACRARRMAVAVSLNISNTFNTVGWDVVRTALERIGFPPYFRGTTFSYLGDRVLHLCDDGQGETATIDVTYAVTCPSGFLHSAISFGTPRHVRRRVSSSTSERSNL